MTKWIPDADPLQARRMNKTAEELGELIAVIGRINNQGMDAIDPVTGKTNRQRLHEESADVLAQLDCNVRAFDMDRDVMWDRQERKTAEMNEWEAHYLPGGQA